MARRCFHVPEGTSHRLVNMVLKKFTDSSDSVVRQLQSLSGFAVQ